MDQVKELVETRYQGPADIEFSIREGGRLYILQNRLLTVAPMADVVVNYHFYEMGIISAAELVHRTRHIVSQPLINTYLDESAKQGTPPLAGGQPISGGVAIGRVVYDESVIGNWPDDDIIYLTKSNVPREVRQESRIKGYLSEEGGVTSHAALVSVGKIPCIVGVDWHEEGGTILIGERGFDGRFAELREGETVTLDANEGYIYRGALPVTESHVNHPEYRGAASAIKRIINKMNAYPAQSPQSSPSQGR
jgi:pyruvate,orthophosphate dikinase